MNAPSRSSFPIHEGRRMDRHVEDSDDKGYVEFVPAVTNLWTCNTTHAESGDALNAYPVVGYVFCPCSERDCDLFHVRLAYLTLDDESMTPEVCWADHAHNSLEDAELHLSWFKMQLAAGRAR